MLVLLDPDRPDAPFPHPDLAESEPNGLLAVGGDLSVPRLVNAYRRGIFPWFSTGQPILWWSPNPRAVLYPDRIKVARSLRKSLKHGGFQVSIDRAFSAVIRACAAPRRDAGGTWLVPQMIAAYEALNLAGLAHSVEVWRGPLLVGGLYGVALGRVFFGESMFSRVNDASKVALVHLANRTGRWGFQLIDCQLHSTHLQRMGAETIGRRDFMAILDDAVVAPPSAEAWRDQTPVVPEPPSRSLLPATA
jgi:leucyl/phenylalanyl-tRNA--protein transferase